VRLAFNYSFFFNILRYFAVNGLRKDESRPSSLTIYLRSARLPLASGAAATCGALPGRKWLLALMREADKAFAGFYPYHGHRHGSLRCVMGSRDTSGP
jgi:hypothetical protein